MNAAVCSGHSPKPAQNGSVLLITLLVVSLLMTLVLAFTVYVRMELSGIRLSQQRAGAQANAKLAASLAIGKLQRLSGPDQRITFPAEADASVTAHPNNRYWLGVRDARRFLPEAGGELRWNPDAGSLSGWLVSGADTLTPDTPQLVGENPVSDAELLVGKGSVNDPADYVAAPRVDVLAPSSQQIGEYAFWVSGENTKAQLNITDPFALDSDPANDAYSGFQVQRNASELFLDLMDSTNPAHWITLGKSLSPRQIDLTHLLSDPGMKQHFHGTTLSAYGLPANPKRGGLKKDLTPVIQEAWDNGGNASGPQFNQLVTFQESRISRLREETRALPGSRPSGVSEKDWNAATALTLREDQALANDRTLMFPPFSDMHLNFDPGGPDWRQLISGVTMRRHAASGARLLPGRTTPTSAKPAPIIAKFNLFTYFTVDWPRVRLYFIPAVVLWNPYSVPLAGEDYIVVYDHKPQSMQGYKLQFKVSNPNWRGGEEIWTPEYRMRYQSSQWSNDFVFQLESVEIPAGAAVIFTMEEHLEIPIQGTAYTSILTPNTAGQNDQETQGYVSKDPITLTAGWHGGGGFGFYVEEPDMNQKIMAYARDWHNVFSSHWNWWDRYNLPLWVEAVTDGDGYTTYPYHVRSAVNQPDPAFKDLAINVNGLDPAQGWRVEATTATLRNRGGDWTNIVNPQLLLGNSTSMSPTSTSYSGQPWVFIEEPLADLPPGLHEAEPEEGMLPILSGLPPNAPSDVTPFRNDPSLFPSFPLWGQSWGLRLPDNSYTYYASEGSGANLGAPSQWIGHYNPASATHARTGLGHRNFWPSTREYDNPPTYIGGFTTDPGYFDLGNTSDDDYHQFIGQSDDLPPTDFQPGDIPRAILFDPPSSVEELTSVADLTQANLQSMQANVTAGVGSVGSRLTGSHSAGMHAANWYPLYAIGNSLQPPQLSPEQATRSVFTTGAGPSSPPGIFPIPYHPWESAHWGYWGHNESGLPKPYVRYRAMYDYSWVLNELLWDDFFFSTEANSRLRWKNGVVTRDFTESAEHLWIEGAFNVNSTSVSAWAALLMGLMDVDIDNVEGNPNPSSNERIPYNRFRLPYSEAYSPDDGDTYSDMRNFTGYRRLTPEEIWEPTGHTGLAVEIVEEVKARGPFLSLSDFVNRSLMSSSSDPDRQRLMGTLQASIDASGINDSQTSVSDGESVITAAEFQGSFEGESHFFGFDTAAASGPANRAAPGYLMQSDLLSKIGSVLQVRSDTFRIRTYGSTGSGTTDAHAWCEVWVRRSAEYVDTTNDPGEDPVNLTAINQQFGRRYEIIGFRWLSDEEL